MILDLNHRRKRYRHDDQARRSSLGAVGRDDPRRPLDRHVLVAMEVSAAAISPNWMNPLQDDQGRGGRWTSSPASRRSS